jgi:prophage tail gpP-like protein
MAVRDDISIVVGNTKWEGWESISLTRGIETVPSTFSLTGTEKYPGSDNTKRIVVMPTSACRIMLGDDVVLTGYVDGIDTTLSPGDHRISVVGRSKLEDIVDCPGALEQQQLVNLTLGSLANMVCQPNGITVSLPDGDSPTIPSISAVLTETGYETIERVARWNAKLIYDDTNGDLVIASVGTKQHVSGFEEGVNIESGASTLNASERYTSIAAIYLDTSILSEGTDTSPIYYVRNAFATDETFQPRADIDPKTHQGRPRHRPLLILAELGQGQNYLVPLRVQWEMARRIGRSQAVTITCDSWRDSAGVLWTPNQLAKVTSPSLKLDETWLISSVTYKRDDSGTHADVTLMPPSAFVPQPTQLYPFDAEVQAASLGQDAGAQTATR